MEKKEEDEKECDHERFSPQSMIFCPDCGETLNRCDNCEHESDRLWSYEYCPNCGLELRS